MLLAESLSESLSAVPSTTLDCVNRLQLMETSEMKNGITRILNKLWSAARCGPEAVLDDARHAWRQSYRVK